MKCAIIITMSAQDAMNGQIHEKGIVIMKKSQITKSRRSLSAILTVKKSNRFQNRQKFQKVQFTRG